MFIKLTFVAEEIPTTFDAFSVWEKVECGR